MREWGVGDNGQGGDRTPPGEAVPDEWTSCPTCAVRVKQKNLKRHLDKHEKKRARTEAAGKGDGLIEVKGRAKGAETVTITRNEIVTALNKPDDFILALVEVDGDNAREPRYVRRPFDKEPGFTDVSANHDLKKLLAMSGPPSWRPARM